MTKDQIIEVLKTRLAVAKEEGNPTEISFLEELVKVVEVRHVAGIDEPRNCETCVYYDTDRDDQPCCGCHGGEHHEMGMRV